MTGKRQKSIRFLGKNELVLETIRVRGRTYFVLEKLSRRGAFRVFDRHAGPNGDYRVLYRFSTSELTKQKMEVIKRFGGKNTNRNFPLIVDFAKTKEFTYVVLTWIWGVSLQEFLREIRAKKVAQPSVYEVIRLFRGLAHGISHLHARCNLVHGDISPANIILTPGTKQLVLVDFGSSWPVENSAQKDSGDGVTPLYAAPERVNQKALEDFRSDCFSLSIIAYELLALDKPFDGLGGRAGLLEDALSNPLELVLPSANQTVRNRITKRAANLIDKLFVTSLAFDPDERFATRSQWLSAWDQLYREVGKGSKLNPWQSSLVNGLEWIKGQFSVLKK